VTKPLDERRRILALNCKHLSDMNKSGAATTPIYSRISFEPVSSDAVSKAIGEP